MISSDLKHILYDRIDSLKLLNEDYEKMEKFCDKIYSIIEEKKIILAKKLNEVTETENFYMEKFQELLKHKNHLENDISFSQQINLYLNSDIEDKWHKTKKDEESYFLGKSLFTDINSIREKIDKKINIVNHKQNEINNREVIIEKEFLELSDEQKEIYFEILMNNYDFSLDYSTKYTREVNKTNDKHMTNNLLGEISVIFEKLKEENFFEKICETEVNLKNINLTPIKLEDDRSFHLDTDPSNLRNKEFNLNRNLHYKESTGNLKKSPSSFKKNKIINKKNLENNNGIKIPIDAVEKEIICEKENENIFLDMNIKNVKIERKNLKVNKLKENKIKKTEEKKIVQKNLEEVKLKKKILLEKKLDEKKLIENKLESKKLEEKKLKEKIFEEKKIEKKLLNVSFILKNCTNLFSSPYEEIDYYSDNLAYRMNQLDKNNRLKFKKNTNPQKILTDKEKTEDINILSKSFTKLSSPKPFRKKISKEKNIILTKTLSNQNIIRGSPPKSNIKKTKTIKYKNKNNDLELDEIQDFSEDNFCLTIQPDFSNSQKRNFKLNKNNLIDISPVQIVNENNFNITRSRNKSNINSLKKTENTNEFFDKENVGNIKSSRGISVNKNINISPKRNDSSPSNHGRQTKNKTFKEIKNDFNLKLSSHRKEGNFNNQTSYILSNQKVDNFPHIKSRYEFLNLSKKEDEIEFDPEINSLVATINITKVENKINNFGINTIRKLKENVGSKYLIDDIDELEVKENLLKSKLFCSDKINKSLTQKIFVGNINK